MLASQELHFAAVVLQAAEAGSWWLNMWSLACVCCLQLSVLQTADEGKGPAAFQMLQYIKLQLDPQVGCRMVPAHGRYHTTAAGRQAGWTSARAYR